MEGRGWNTVVQIGGQSVNALIDTGAHKSVIRAVLAKAAGLYEHPYQTINLRGPFPGTDMTARLLSDATISLAGEQFIADLIISKTNQQMLLGWDFLIRYDCILDCGKQQFLVNGRDIQIHPGQSRGAPTICSLAQEVEALYPNQLTSLVPEAGVEPPVVPDPGTGPQPVTLTGTTILQPIFTQSTRSFSSYEPQVRCQTVDTTLATSYVSHKAHEPTLL